MKCLWIYKYFGHRHCRKSIQLTSNEAVKQAVIADLGYSILPLIGIKNELFNGQLHIVPSKNLPIISHWRLIWLKDKVLSPIASAYLDFVRSEKENIIKQNFDWYIKFNSVWFLYGFLIDLEQYVWVAKPISTPLVCSSDLTFWNRSWPVGHMEEIKDDEM